LKLGFTVCFCVQHDDDDDDDDDVRSTGSYNVTLSRQNDNGHINVIVGWLVNVVLSFLFSVACQRWEQSSMFVAAARSVQLDKLSHHLVSQSIKTNLYSAMCCE